ncbi:hypothetical protein AB1Y20_017556 [Prymnesium parvum]|uniref:Methyltransferase FkbM domain-containing protein n=1 Tax=Prymnesium parvum TaxID=97485 RepID=A0AB34JPT4_PRYPA
MALLFLLPCGQHPRQPESEAFGSESTRPSSIAESANPPSPGRRLWFGLSRAFAREARGVSRCTDTCPSAHNGVCDDGADLVAPQPSIWPSRGRKGRAVSLSCDLGTDCADCRRARTLHAFASLPQAMRGASDGAPSVPTQLPTEPSVEGLVAAGVQVNAAWTRTEPPFVMLYTNPAADVDVSAAMAAKRMVEPLYNLFWHRLGERCCAAGGLALDVGANFGYYSLYAAKMGCRVVAWEPVPAFRKFIKAAAQLNNLSHLIHLRAAVVSDTAGQTVEVHVPSQGIWGTASVDGLNVDPSVRSSRYRVSVTTERLDDVVSEQACIMKLDVEGFEPKVIAGAEQMLARRPPHHILTEYTPGVMERQQKWAALAAYPASLRTLWRAGYRIFNLEGTSKNSEAAAGGAWRSQPLPPLREVSNASLHAEEVNSRNMITTPGFSVPWDLHPRSLHAEFAHNTDLLLTRHHSAVPRSRDVGVWADSAYGLGGGLCKHVLRDGTVQEMLGRLCVAENREERIAQAVAAAEPREGYPAVRRPVQVREEARHWKIVRIGNKRVMVRRNESDSAPPRGRGKRRGKAKGRRRVSNT